MNRYTLNSMIFVAGLLVVFSCAHNKLSDYEPKTTNEKEIIDTMVECFTAYKEQDLSKWLDCFEEDAQIRIYSGGDGVQDDHPMLSKQQYKTWLEAGGHGLQSYNLINPKIRVTGNSAIFNCDNLVSGTAIQIESDLINKKDQWKMIKLRWTFRGH